MRVGILAITSGGALAAGVVLSSATARPVRCLSDAEVEQALGKQVESAAPFLDASSLPESPMCSGLTIAEYAQHMRAVEVERLRVIGSADELDRAEAALRGGDAAQAAAMAALEASKAGQPLDDRPPDMSGDGIQPPPVRLRAEQQPRR